MDSMQDQVLGTLTVNPVGDSPAQHLRHTALAHPCSHHPLFSYLREQLLNRQQIAGLLKNYDAHASALRRLLLRAATLMPEEAVGYILENVRNEYGNGNPAHRHQLQIWDLAQQVGVTAMDFQQAKIEPEIRLYIRQVTSLYYPCRQWWTKPHLRPAIAGGAIAATELLALVEFAALHKAFAAIGHGQHIWFNHLYVEAEHSDESLDLAVYFIDKFAALSEVEFGLKGVLQSNLHLYDGLLASLERSR